MFRGLHGPGVADETAKKTRSKSMALQRCHTQAPDTFSRLARPASLGKNQPPFVGIATKRASQFEGFVSLRSGRHLPRLLQRSCGSFIPIQSIPIR